MLSLKHCRSSKIPGESHRRQWHECAGVPTSPPLDASRAPATDDFNPPSESWSVDRRQQLEYSTSRPDPTGTGSEAARDDIDPSAPRIEDGIPWDDEDPWVANDGDEEEGEGVAGERQQEHEGHRHQDEALQKTQHAVQDGRQRGVSQHDDREAAMCEGHGVHRQVMGAHHPKGTPSGTQATENESDDIRCTIKEGSAAAIYADFQHVEQEAKRASRTMSEGTSPEHAAGTGSTMAGMNHVRQAFIHNTRPVMIEDR